MAYTNVWSNTTPLGTAAANTIDNIFRSLKVDITDRFTDLFAMPNFTDDPLRPYGIKFTDAQDAVISLGDNSGTPRSLIVKNKANSATYWTVNSIGVTNAGTLTNTGIAKFSDYVGLGTAVPTFLAATSITPGAGQLVIIPASQPALMPQAVTVLRLNGAPTIFAGTINGTASVPTTVVSSNQLGNIGMGGYDGVSVVNGPLIIGYATETWSASAHGSKMVFHVRPNTTTTLTVALTIDQDKSATFAGTGSFATGLTVVSGTSAIQALTATTGVLSSTFSAVGITSSNGLIVSSGTSALQDITATTISASGQIIGTGGVTGSTEAARFGAIATPAGVSSLFTALNIVSSGPATNTASSLGGSFLGIGYGASVLFHGAVSGGTVTAPTAAPTNRGVGFRGIFYDGTAWGLTPAITIKPAEFWAVGAHGTAITFSVTAIGTVSTGGTIALTINNDTTATFASTVTITAGGFTVSSGTSSLQAITATTVVATTFTGALTGNASTATALQTARTINGISFDGTANIIVSAGTVGTLTFGTYLQAASAVFAGSDATIATNATSANTVSTLVARDGSGNFSAGTVTLATGLTVSSGTSALQAITGTTLVLSSSISATTFAFSGNGTGGTYNSQTISSSANFTGTLVVSTSVTSAFFRGVGSNYASSGLLRLQNTNVIGWSNAAATGDITLKVDATDNFIFSSSVNIAGDMTVGSSSSYAWSTIGTALKSPSSGVIGLYNGDFTTFSRLQFGGTTSSFPSIKRNSAAINFRLADDSADAAITAGAITGSNGLTISSGTSALQALTATTGTFSSNISVAAGSFVYLNSQGGNSFIRESSSGVIGIQAGGTITLQLDAGNLWILSNALIVSPASTTSGASIRVPHGAAPTSPVNGDIWTTTGGMFVRINGATKSVNLT